MPLKDKIIWDEHWNNLKRKQHFFSKVLNLVRKKVIANEIACTINKYFPKEGVFVDCGAGTSETAIKIKRYKRKLIALDISFSILKDNKLNAISADVSKLPFKNNSIDGIWNVGVMEHFDKNEINIILEEFSRVLKKDSYFIAFWPSVYGPVNILFFILEKLTKKDYFPNEPSLFKSEKGLKNILDKNKKFALDKIRWALRGGLIYHTIILRKI